VVYSAFWESPSAWYEVALDPYRGAVLAIRDQRRDPFDVILRLHRNLLLPETLGRWIVGVAVVVSAVPGEPFTVLGQLTWRFP
jgi:uncharacterized iron-regulated membrane protein